jgi:hypothetical protein
MRIKLNESILNSKKFNSEFVCTWEYVVMYVNELLYNLNLYEKVMTGESTLEEREKWYKIFYNSDNRISIKTILLNMPNINKINDYSKYKSFVIDEVKRCEPFIELHLSAARKAVYSLKKVQKRIDSFNIE